MNYASKDIWLINQIIQLCRQESGFMYLVLMIVVVVSNYLPIKSWVRKIFKKKKGKTNVHSDLMKGVNIIKPKTVNFIQNYPNAVDPQSKEEQNDD